VPALAPSLAAGILALGPWQLVFWLCAAAGVGMAVTATRLPETLDPADRTPLDFAGVWASCRTVVKTPGTMGYVLSMTALFAAFLSYLSSSEIILDEVFDMSEWFPVFFGAIAVVMGIAVFINGRIVVRIGLDRLIKLVFMCSAPSVTALLVLSLATDGRPGFWLFLLVLSAVLFAQQMLIPNLNAAGMRPLAHVAGTGSAILGMVPGVVGSIVGLIVDRQFDGSITPMCLSFAICTALAIGFWRWAIIASRKLDTHA
jgi:MFS transporter, DHA1 family, multidrug resistance protein